jgi:hypothetical protein
MATELEYNYYTETELQSNSKLVLFIEELSKNNDEIVERKIFICFDNVSSTFFIKGKVVDSDGVNYVPFSFSHSSRSNIYQFIKFIVDKCPVNLVLYNYNNLLDKDIETLPYEFFEHLLDESYEIAGYDKDTIYRKRFINLLNVLKISN